MTVPGAGFVMVTANVNMFVYHTTATLDRIQVAIGSTAMDCGNFEDDVTWDTPASYPSFTNTYQAIAVQRVFSVASAGTYTFYLNGQKLSGNVAVPQDSFNYAAMHAFYLHP